MPELHFSGFNLDRQQGARVSSWLLTRREAGKPPPAPTGRGMRRVFYTGFMLGAPVGRADVGLAAIASALWLR